MENKTNQTKVENANATPETNTQMYETQTYKRTIVGAQFDDKTNAVFLRFDEPYNKGSEQFDSFGKGVNKLCESGAHPLFILVVKKGIKPIESSCLFIGAQIRFDVVFVKSGETIDGYTIENDGFCVTNVRISENQPSAYFIEAAKEEKNSVQSL